MTVPAARFPLVTAPDLPPGAGPLPHCLDAVDPAPALVDPAIYLRVAELAVAVDGPQALARWWRGEVQRLLPQRALLLTALDGAAPAGVPQWLGDAPWRGEAAACALAAPLALAWAAGGHRPRHVTPAEAPRAEGLGAEGCWVHGLRGRRLFAFIGVPEGPGGNDTGIRQALSLLVPLLDAALRGAGDAPQPLVERAPRPLAVRRAEPGADTDPATGKGTDVAAAATGWARDAPADGTWRLPISSPITMRRQMPGALSERERQIMAWVAQGKTNPEIGCILRISEFTVKNHLKSIFSKLDVTNRAQAVARMTRLALHA